MICAEFFEDGAGIFAGLKLLGDLLEVLLILVQVGPADFKQLVERDVDHFVVLEFLCEVIGADAEVAVELGQQVGLEPVEIGLERGDDGGVGLGEFCFEGGSLASAKAAGTSCWKKLMMPGNCSMAISVEMRGGFLRLARA